MSVAGAIERAEAKRARRRERNRKAWARERLDLEILSLVERVTNAMAEAKTTGLHELASQILFDGWPRVEALAARHGVETPTLLQMRTLPFLGSVVQATRSVE